MGGAVSEQLHILVIDDDADMRELLAHVLLGYGHQVILAESAEEGLSQLPFYTFDVALLDQNLPGMEGLVLGEYLQKNNPEMSIALVTGESSDRLKRLCANRDIRFIEKPFDVDQILDVVASYRSRRRAQEVDESPHFDLNLDRYLAGLPDAFQMPNLPQRVQDTLARRIRESLDRMELSRQVSEHDRAVAYAGLVAALVLGLRLPKLKDGSTLFARYDRLMTAHGCRRAFDDVG